MRDTGQVESLKPAMRLQWLDLARGIAVIAMTVFHFTWDLEYFGYAAQGLTSETGWKLFARAIASSFLFLAGFSFLLAHRNGLKTKAFAKRFAQITAAAAIISFATWWTTPERFVFFGILHQIAAASLLAALVVRWPSWALGALAIFLFALPTIWRSEVFHLPALWWAGLAPYDPPSNDYVPVFPWTGWVVLGLAAARLALNRGWLVSSAQRRASSMPSKITQFLGRHSLVYYLAHQPIMIGLLSLLTMIAPPAARDPSIGFIKACVENCAIAREEAYCTRFCGCVKTDLEGKNIFAQVANGQLGADDHRVAASATMCTQAAEEN